MEFQYLTVEVADRVCYITLNRPEKRNALSPDLVTELKAGIKMAVEHLEVRCVVLNANGPAFCAGADLAYLQQLQNNSFEENLVDSTHLLELFQMIYESPLPFIAEVQGDAIAGGCGLATICDFVFAAETAKFGYTEVKIGFIPAIVSVFLIRKIGEAKSRYLLLSGELLSAQEAFQYNLVNRVMPAEELKDFTMNFAKNLSEKTSKEAIKATRRLIANLQDLPYGEALKFAANENAIARATSDCKKGISGFLNKEKLKW